MDGGAYGAVPRWSTITRWVWNLSVSIPVSRRRGTGRAGGKKAFALWPVARKVVDPVMGDNGRAYSTVTPAFIDRMRKLTAQADLILPNATEAALLLQKDPVPAELDEAAQALADALAALPQRRG